MPRSVFDAATTEPSSQPESMEVDPPDYASQAPSTPISTQALQTVSDEREAKRQEQRNNSNIIPRDKKKTGAPIDELCASLAIECVEPKGNGKGEATYYYCIGCDERRANNSRSRALPHAKKCKVCTLLSCC
jgi:hypothetical protein